MKIIEMPRGAGKTTNLIEWLVNGQALPGEPNIWNRAIVVSSRREAEMVRDMIRVRIGAPTTWFEDPAQSEAYRRWCVLSAAVTVATDIRANGTSWTDNRIEVAVDELADVLTVLLRHQPVLATWTPDGY